jgi:hypothetical protein
MRSARSRVGFVFPVGLAAVLSSLPPSVEAQRAGAYEVSYLELAGAGGLSSFHPRRLLGGEPEAELMEGGEPGNPDLRPGPVRYTPIVAEVLPSELAGLARGWLDGSKPRLDGRFMVLGADGSPQMQRGFTQALITELGFPALDARQPGQIYLRLTLVPPETRSEPGAASPSGGYRGNKTAVSVGFSLQLDGLDPRWVSRIEPFTIAASGRNQEQAGPIHAATRLTVTIAPAGAAQLTSWLESFVVMGNHQQGAERSLVLRILNPDMTSALTLGGHGVGILALRRVPSDQSSQFQVDLYVERWEVL